MSQKSRTLPLALYSISAICFVFYIIYSLTCSTVIRPMVRLLFLLITCSALYAGSILLSKRHREHEERIMKTTFIAFFALYLLLIITLVLFDSYFGRTGAFPLTSAPYSRSSANLKLFSTIKSYLKSINSDYYSKEQILINLLGNLVAFMPLSFFLPLLFRPMRSFWKFTATALGIIITVEVLQLIFMVGQCDIDDVLLNFSGTLLAFGILQIKPLKQLSAKFTKLKP